LIERLEKRTHFTIAGTSLGIWHSYAQATNDLANIHSAYPNLTQLISIGQTVQGREIWAMRITDNPTIDENEPEFLYQGSMHGDEPVGMAMSLYFIQHLLENYGSDTRITGIVNNTDIRVVPNLNWDGYMRSGGAIRGNANFVDLNRNFPEWTATSFSFDTVHFGTYGNVYDGPAPVTNGLEPETVAMMNWRVQHRFVASANLHSGELVANYGWDTNGNFTNDYAATPDDALLRQMALVYASNNPPMFGNPSFPQGITNGDEWYPISGGEQDWAYLYLGTNELTLELSVTKFPSALTLPTLWNNNREAMLSLVETAHWGVAGLVTGALNGLPLNAKVTVTGPVPNPTPDPNHPATHPVFTDPDLGDYHRMLRPGNYTIRFESPGYVTQTVSGIVVNGSGTTALNAQLTPVDTTPPTVSGNFDFNAAKPRLLMQVSEDVGASLTAGDLNLVNLTTGQTVATGAISMTYSAQSKLATFAFPGLAGQMLPDGNYRATLAAGNVADPWGNGNLVYSHDFFVLGGDADRDRDVDVNDLGILASNWQQSPRTFSQGDFDYSGTIDVNDLGILASHWQQGLAPAAPVQKSRRAVDRVTEQVFA
jgi:carboxypeptidase D